MTVCGLLLLVNCFCSFRVKEFSPSSSEQTSKAIRRMFDHVLREVRHDRLLLSESDAIYAITSLRTCEMVIAHFDSHCRCTRIDESAYLDSEYVIDVFR